MIVSEYLASSPRTRLIEALVPLVSDLRPVQFSYNKLGTAPQALRTTLQRERPRTRSTTPPTC